MSATTNTRPEIPTRPQTPPKEHEVYHGAKPRLMADLKSLAKEKWVEVEPVNGSLFRWSVGLMVINEESAFNGAYLKAEMTFTDQYPHQPPTFKFQRKITHPNIYPDGKLCISILHAPGEDEQSGELASERWSPLHSVESVLRSVLLLLDDPEINSPANVDAGILYRDNKAKYFEEAKQTVAASKKDIPAGFEMPTTLVDAAPTKMDDDADFWNESDDEEDFGASDSEDDFQMDEDDDEDGGDQEFQEDDEEVEE